MATELPGDVDLVGVDGPDTRDQRISSKPYAARALRPPPDPHAHTPRLSASPGLGPGPLRRHRRRGWHSVRTRDPRPPPRAGGARGRGRGARPRRRRRPRPRALSAAIEAIAHFARRSRSASPSRRAARGDRRPPDAARRLPRRARRLPRRGGVRRARRAGRIEHKLATCTSGAASASWRSGTAGGAGSSARRRGVQADRGLVAWRRGDPERAASASRRWRSPATPGRRRGRRAREQHPRPAWAEGGGHLERSLGSPSGSRIPASASPPSTTSPATTSRPAELERAETLVRDALALSSPRAIATTRRPSQQPGRHRSTARPPRGGDGGAQASGQRFAEVGGEGEQRFPTRCRSLAEW